MKKFGKLRQWTDEKLGASQKTLATEEFRDMEIEMQTRHQGLEAIHSAATVWMRALGKKKEGQDKEKGIPLELLGVALFQHGEEFAPDSAYGQALSRFGIAQQKVARAQESFQQKVNDSVITNMERSLAAMKEYQAAKKKLESRRLTYDAILGKVQKAKKEDFKLEEELRAAKVRYEEVNDDVHQRMIAIRDAEAINLRDIADFIDAEAEYFESARDIMSQVRSCFRTETGNRPINRSRKASQSSISREDVAVSSPRRSAYNMKSSISATSLPESIDPFLSRHQPSTGHMMLSTSSRTRSQQSLPRRKNSSSSEETETRPTAMTRLKTEPTHAGAFVNLKKVRVNFSFDAEAETEMSIVPGEIISVIEEVSDGWWEGQVIDDQDNQLIRRGLFPANYCSPYISDKVGVLPATRSTALRLESMPSIEDESSLQYRAQTFPRFSRDLNPSSAFNVASSMRSRPPPPPIPKKKQSTPVSLSPHRMAASTFSKT